MRTRFEHSTAGLASRLATEENAWQAKGRAPRGLSPDAQPQTQGGQILLDGFLEQRPSAES